MPSRPASLPVSIGRFRVDALLGSGGMGEVYKAFDPTLQRAVAVKTVRPDISTPEFIDRLIREAQACARLKHPNVVTVYEAGEIGGVVYIVMEYLQGEDLGTVLKRGGLTFDAKIRTLVQVLDALQHSHNEGVIHRDIKPSNVHRQSDGSVKVVDFGLARVAQASPLTQSGGVLCTPDYASPEQLRGEKLDRRTDVYSTGALAYEVFTGRRPFQGDSGSVGAVILKVVSEPAPPMDVSWSRRFPEIERIVARAMAKAPGDRYQSAEDMRNALQAFLASSQGAIAAAQAELDAYEQRTVIEARTLIATGKIVVAEAMLSETLQANPDAQTVRALLAETRMDAPSAEVTQPALHGRSELRTDHQLDQTGPASATSRMALKTWWWLGATAAVLVLGTLVVVPRVLQTTPDIGGAQLETGAEATVEASNGSAGGSTFNPVSGAGALNPTGTVAASAPATRAEDAVAPAPVAAPPAAGVTRDVSAKMLFEGGAGTPNAGRNAGLRYRLTRRSPDGSDADVDPATTTFHSGDRVRFSFDSNIDGYLYVVQQGSSGRWAVLFPGPQINGGRNAVARGEQYQVPSNDWFLFDANPGTEQLFVFLSRAPLTQLPGFDRPVTRAETVVASIVDDLQTRIRPRDLVLEKVAAGTIEGGAPGQATYVVNRAEMGQAVAASITLIHAP